MMLNPSQLKQVMDALTGKVDKQVLETVNSLLGVTSSAHILAPGDTYTNIRSYSERLQAQFVANGRGIVADDPNNEVMVVYMEVDQVKRLLSQVPQNGYVAALPGVHNASGTGQDQVTISLLAADAARNIIPGHIGGSVMGEEAWDNINIMANLAQVLPTPVN
ncbi:MAG: hypothetical protein EOP51_32575 [Sphingobacteriales bacterium]|nr:MAG: hypothetical protein EOP51_32575 [Sphingobacteriales bacterium]